MSEFSSSAFQRKVNDVVDEACDFHALVKVETPSSSRLGRFWRYITFPVKLINILAESPLLVSYLQKVRLCFNISDVFYSGDSYVVWATKKQIWCTFPSTLKEQENIVQSQKLVIPKNIRLNCSLAADAVPQKNQSFELMSLSHDGLEIKTLQSARSPVLPTSKHIHRAQLVIDQDTKLDINLKLSHVSISEESRLPTNINENSSLVPEKIRSTLLGFRFVDMQSDQQEALKHMLEKCKPETSSNSKKVQEPEV